MCYHGVNFCDIGKEAGAAAGVPVKEKLTNEAFCLTLPDKEAMRSLEADGLGELPPPPKVPTHMHHH